MLKYDQLLVLKFLLLFFFVEFIFQDSLMNRKLKTKAFIWNWKLYMSLL